MDNHTSFSRFKIVFILTSSEYKSYFFSVVLMLYVIGALANSVIIAVVYNDNHLHTPMYLFLCNLSFIDLCYTTVTIPRLLYMLLSGDYTVSFIQCFTQMYFFYAFAGTEAALLSTMAYDRYVAICKPLHYHCIFNRKHCVQLTAAIWLSGYFNALFFLFIATKLFYYYSHIIHQYFCDAISLMNNSSTNKKVFLIFMYAELLVCGLFSFSGNLTSYIKIISAILKIKSRDGRRKAFSTCSSHLTVLTIFYGTAVGVHIITPSDHNKVLELIFTLLYTVFTPVLNPLIYSLQNNDIKKALKELLSYNKATFEIT